MNNSTFSGRIISVRPIVYQAKDGSDGTGLSIKISVLTGQRAEADAKYPPSMIVEATIWGKLAEARLEQAVKGNAALVSGKLAAPVIYRTDTSEGIEVKFHEVTALEIIPTANAEPSDNYEAAPAVTVSSTQSKAKKAKVEQSADVDDIPF